MDRTERFYKITQLLEGRDAVPREELLEMLGVSLATFKRDLEYMRDRLHPPIIWDGEKRGYRLDNGAPKGPRFQLPGVWLNDTEAHAYYTARLGKSISIATVSDSSTLHSTITHLHRKVRAAIAAINALATSQATPKSSCRIRLSSFRTFH